MNLYAEAISTKLIPETGTPPSPREVSGLVVDSDGKYLYIYGGRSDIKHSDMWKFDLTTPTWTKIHPASVLTPGPRSSSFMTTLKDDRSKILLFGGDNSNGPISDVWIYDTDNESVIYIQWKLIDDKGKAPPRAFGRSICDYMHNGKQYLAVYGGKNRTDLVRSLFM